MKFAHQQGIKPFLDKIKRGDSDALQCVAKLIDYLQEDQQGLRTQIMKLGELVQVNCNMIQNLTDIVLSMDATLERHGIRREAVDVKCELSKAGGAHLDPNIRVDAGGSDDE